MPPVFTVYNTSVDDAFGATMDPYHETYTQIAQLLERGVRVLVYAGTHDWICNWLSNEIWTLEMPWSGQRAFASQPLEEWQFNGAVAGQIRSANGLTFITFYDAGHMVGSSFSSREMKFTSVQVPMDQPERALALVQSWLAREPL